MNFPSIDIQGSILSTDLLAKIRSEQANYQQGKDFNSDFTNAKLKDDISWAWQEAKGQWTIFKSKLARLKEGENGTKDTRNFWITPLLANLNYSLGYNRVSEELNGKSFPIWVRENNLDGFPIYVGGYHESLDKRPDNKQLRVSPHAMVQEYLNYSEHLYGIVTNGRKLRLLRDASRITRLSYVEFDLEKMMEEDLYSDFVIFYRVLHASRMPKKIDGGAESIIEKYHQEGLEAGSTIRHKLGDAVKETIKNLANGFINHPNNIELREAMAAGNINADEYYHHQLRIIYRLLFLFVIEERNLVYADSKTPETKRFNHIYFNYYSLFRLRKLAKKLPPPEAARHYDLWQSLVGTFSLFEKKEIGEKLGIMSLQGNLFGYNAINHSYYDLHQCYLNNSVLLNIIKSLSYFENNNKVLIAVNYGGLDVEEFGSVYEGLLELKLNINKIEGSEKYSCSFDSSNERGKSGSHYTPEELVQPLIKHSLEYLIEDRIKPYYQKQATKENTLQSLLSLKICDVACGSGHILLSAARRVALEIARVQTEEEQPNPLAIRKAMKDVVRNCIYGVDKNPLAVELCKIALWLEAYNPGEPLNFLDHHIKCGDAIVGLAHKEELENGIADEAFKTLPGDDKDIAKSYRDKNIKERKERIAKATQLKAEFEKTTEGSVQEAMFEYKTFSKLPESTPEEIDSKALAYKKFIDGKGFTFLKAMADTQVAQFLIPKTDAHKDFLMTDGDFRLILSGYKGWQDRKVAKATTVAIEQRFFHWFIEFPEIFSEGGFDCVLGNPPYLGGKKISGSFGQTYLETIHYFYNGVGGQSDLIAYFIRRIYSILSNKRFFAVITTNSISEGDTRQGSLDVIIAEGGQICFAIKSTKWPGVANLNVALLSVFNSQFLNKKVLNQVTVNNITSYLDEADSNVIPKNLRINHNLMYRGVDFGGTGFILERHEAKELLKIDSYRKVVVELINGDEINNEPDQAPQRYIINFYDFEEAEAKKYELAYNIVHEKVKPYRQSGNDKKAKEKWWIYKRNKIELYNELNKINFCFVTGFTSKYLAFSKLRTDIVMSNALNILNSNQFNLLTLLHSTIHEDWVRKYSSSLESRLRYSSTDVFETFPFPQNLGSKSEQQLEVIGLSYHEHREQIMLGMQLGLTKIYNLFHSNAITSQSNNEKDKQVASLQKHLEKTTNTVPFDEAIQGVLKLRELHVQMDEAVLDAYGWSIDSAQGSAIKLRHDFYEVDYLPENDRVRYTIHPDARKEVLKRLLELNHQIHEEEVKAGLWDKKKVSKKIITKEKEKENEGQLSLLQNINTTMKEWSLNDGIYSIMDCADYTGLSKDKIKRWFGELKKENYEGFAADHQSDVNKLRISFHGLIELVVIGTLRENGFSLKKIMKARADLKEKSNKTYYPFATNNVRDNLKVAGKDLIFEFPDGLVTLNGTEQYNLDIIRTFFKDIVFDINGIAESIIPVKGKGFVVINPREANGKPAIKNKEVLVDSIIQFYQGPSSVEMIKEQFNLEDDEILAAVEYNN